MRHRWRAGLPLLLALAAAGCGSDGPAAPAPPVGPPTGPVTRDELVGSWDAIELRTVAGRDTVDLLALGGAVMLTFEASAQVGGRLLAPGLGPGGSVLNADMNGIWSFDPVTRTVRLAQSADTFMGNAVLRPERTEGGFGIDLTASIPADGFRGTPAIDLRLRKR